MGEAGLQAVMNPSAVFLQDREAAPNVSAAVTVMVEGTRPLLLEVQALCSRVNYVSPPPGTQPLAVRAQSRPSLCQTALFRLSPSAVTLFVTVAVLSSQFLVPASVLALDTT